MPYQYRTSRAGIPTWAKWLIGSYVGWLAIVLLGLAALLVYQIRCYQAIQAMIEPLTH